MKHGLSRSPLSLITNFLSNIDFFKRYGSSIIGVSGTLGTNAEKTFMSDTFSVEFATIPTSKRRKIFELDGFILNDEWLTEVVSHEVKSVASKQRAVLVLCEYINTANEIHERCISNDVKESALHLLTKDASIDKGRMMKELKPGDVVITTNLGARGTDFVTDDVVNKNGGLFVLVTFIPLNDRVEKQAFGRTGRRGATGSCQIIVAREAMPEWARQCETVDEVKSLRDFIEMHRLSNMTEVTLMQNKQNLFREYCEMRNKFVISSTSEPDDIEIQLELLDETWAKWKQDVETRTMGLNHADLVEELRRNIEACSILAKQFVSDNIYHLQKFGAVRLMKGDFQKASEFYDRVIDMDPAWSAFAHYNRAYCTIQMKGDGYIRRAVIDLKTTLCKLETYKNQPLFHEIHCNVYTLFKRYHNNVANSRHKQYHIIMECQLLHHLDTQITETIEKLEKIDSMEGKVTTVRRDILDLIPGADCRTEQMLEKYRQLGLLFLFNINEKPKFYMNRSMSSLVVLLKSMAVGMLGAFSSGILLKDYSIDIGDAICQIRSLSDPLKWMLTCFSKVIMTGIHSFTIIRDVSSLFLIKEIEQDPSSEMTTGTSQFEQFANSQATSLLNLFRQKINISLSSREDARLSHITKVATLVLRKHIQGRVSEGITPGQKLHQALCHLHSSLISEPKFDSQQFINRVTDLVQISVHSSKLSDIHTVELENLAVKLISQIQCETAAITSQIEAAAEKIEIETTITKFADIIIHGISVDENSTGMFMSSFDDMNIPEATHKILLSTWSDIICSIVQRRIELSVVLNVQEESMRDLYETICMDVPFAIQMKFTRELMRRESSDASRRATEMCKDLMETRYLHVPSITEARLLSESEKFTIIILDVDKEKIIQIHSLEKCEKTIELIYYPPSPTYPTGHYDAYSEDGEVLFTDDDKIQNKGTFQDDYSMLLMTLDIYYNSCLNYQQSKLLNHVYIREHPRRFEELLVNEHYACQLKRGRALLRLDMNHPTRQINQGEYVELDSSNLFSSIEQASNSENVSQLAKVLAEYELESRSAEVKLPERGTGTLISSMSRDACKIFRSSGESVEAKVYRQLVVERIHDGYITTALKLCCIGYQVPFCRVKIGNLPISIAQTLRDTFDQMLKMESYEKSKFQSVCDEWFKVLEPRGLMNIEQRELLKEWISTRQYANTEDPVVSLVIEKCLRSMIEKENRERDGATMVENIVSESDDDDDADEDDDDDDDDDKDDGNDYGYNIENDDDDDNNDDGDKVDDDNGDDDNDDDFDDDKDHGNDYGYNIDNDNYDDSNDDDDGDDGDDDRDLGNDYGYSIDDDDDDDGDERGEETL